MKSSRKAFVENLVKKAGLIPENAILEGDRFSWEYVDPQGHTYTGGVYMYVFADKVKDGHVLRIKFSRNPVKRTFQEIKEKIQELVPEGVEVEVRNSDSPYIDMVIQLNFQGNLW